jgi:glycosyltransferase involved in cell wall biosynthesis
MNFPLVSVVITTYNRNEFLEQAIGSVINQSYRNFEILVIDDGSTNNYAESICNKFNNCNYFYKENGGVSSARNYGIKKSKGAYIAFLDDDDYWRSDKLEKQVVVLENNNEVDCVHSSAIVVDEWGIETGKIIGASEEKAHKRSGYVFWNALGVWLVKASTPLIRKKVFVNEMVFDETLEAGEDIDFYQRMFYRHKVLYLNEPLVYYREYSDLKRLSLQKDKYIGVEKKMYDNFVKMGISNPIMLYRISRKLLKSYTRRLSNYYPEKKIKISFFKKNFIPKLTLKKYKFDKK